MANATLPRDAAVASLGPLREAVAATLHPRRNQQLPYSVPERHSSDRTPSAGDPSPREAAAAELRPRGKRQRPGSVPEESGSGRAPSPREATIRSRGTRHQRRLHPRGKGSAKGGGVVLPGSPPQQCARTPLRSGSPTGPRGPPVTGPPLGSPSKRTCPQRVPWLPRPSRAHLSPRAGQPRGIGCRRTRHASLPGRPARAYRLGLVGPGVLGPLASPAVPRAPVA